MIGWRVLLWVVIMMAILAFLYAVRGVLLPFVIAFALSAILDPVIRKLRLRGWSRPVSVLSVMGVFFGVLILFGAWLGPIVGTQVGNMRTRIDEISQSILTPRPEDNFFVRWNPIVQAGQDSERSQFDTMLESNASTLRRFGLPGSRQELLDKYVEPHKGDIGRHLQSFFASFLGIVGAAASQLFLLIFVPVLMILILLDMEHFKRRSASWIPPSIRASTMSMLSDIGQVFMKYLRGVTISVVAYMVVMSIVLSILGAPYSVLLGVIFGAVYLIPILNVVISGVLLLTITGLSGKSGDWFLHFASPWTFGIVLAMIFMACHLVFDNLVYPRVVGAAVGLHPVISMFVIFSGGALFGLVGMILAFPLAGAVKVILERLLRVTGMQQEVLRLPAVPLRHRGT